MSTRTVRLALGGAFALTLVAVALMDRPNDPADVAPANNVDTVAPAPPQAERVRDESPQTQDIPDIAEPALPSAQFARNEAGVRAAAVMYLEATEEIVHLSPEQAGEFQRAMSTDAAAVRLGGDVEEQMTRLVTQSPQGVQVWLAPLEARSIEIDGGYEVSIWYAEVIAIGTSATVDNWRTVTYVLMWERGTWLIDDKTSVEGPVPTRSGGLLVTAPSTLISILTQFDDAGLTP